MFINTPQSLLWGFLLIPTLEKGGKGGLLRIIIFPNDTPLSLRRGGFISFVFALYPINNINLL